MDAVRSSVILRSEDGDNLISNNCSYSIEDITYLSCLMDRIDPIFVPPCH